VEFPVSSAVDDVDQQVREHENSYVFVGAVHPVLVKSDSSACSKINSVIRPMSPLAFQF